MDKKPTPLEKFRAEKTKYEVYTDKQTAADFNAKLSKDNIKFPEWCRQAIKKYIEKK